MDGSADDGVDAVLIDMGGVLLRWDPVRLYARLLGDRIAAEQLVAAIELYRWNDALDRGARFADVIPRWQRAHPQHAREIAAYRERWVETLAGPEPGSADVVDALRAAGVPVALLSNVSTETFPLCCQVAPVLTRLDGAVLSGAEGHVKPEAALYRIALQRFGFVAARTVFVDDRAENVAAAEAHGMRGVRFTDVATLRRDLAALGLPAVA